MPLGRRFADGPPHQEGRHGGSRAEADEQRRPGRLVGEEPIHGADDQAEPGGPREQQDLGAERRRCHSSSTGRFDRILGSDRKFPGGGGESVHHSSVPPPHGLAGWSAGERMASTTATRNGSTPMPSKADPTVDSMLSSVQPLAAA